MYLGKKLDMRAIADPGGAVYKRTFPGKKTDAVVCVLVDNSGSMIGHRIEAAKVAALTLYDFCRKAGIPILVYGASIRMVTIIVIQVRKPFIFTVMQSSRKTETTVCGSSLWKTMAVTGTGQPFYLWQISF
ncbi:MAG: cobaltochelatase CobT-related protein [Blautia faecis]